MQRDQFKMFIINFCNWLNFWPKMLFKKMWKGEFWWHLASHNMHINTFKWPLTDRHMPLFISNVIIYWPFAVSFKIVHLFFSSSSSFVLPESIFISYASNWNRNMHHKHIYKFGVNTEQHEKKIRFSHHHHHTRIELFYIYNLHTQSHISIDCSWYANVRESFA